VLSVGRALWRSCLSAACCPNRSASSRCRGGMPPGQGVQVFSARVSIMGDLHHGKRDTGGCFVSDQYLMPPQEVTPSDQTRSGSVLQCKRDDDVCRFGFVQLETGPAVVGP